MMGLWLYYCQTSLNEGLLWRSNIVPNFSIRIICGAGLVVDSILLEDCNMEEERKMKVMPDQDRLE